MNKPGELVKLADGAYGTCDYECSDEACGNCGHSWICHHEHRNALEDDSGDCSEVEEGHCCVGFLGTGDPVCGCTEFTHTGRTEGDPDDD
jgi:hypothetical protein